MFSGNTKGNIDPKWVKQRQYRQEWRNLMLLAWNASSTIVKQNQTAVSKTFSLFYTTNIKDIRQFFKGLVFRAKLVLY